MNPTSLSQWIEFLNKLIFPATMTTIRMVLIVVFIGYSVGLVIGSSLYIYSPSGLSPNQKKYGILNFFVNLIRSIPILILIVAMIPVTRAIIGTSVGPNAVIIPLSVAAIGFLSRYLENVFYNVDPLTIEAARSYGATNKDIMFNIVYVESVPGMISTLTIAFVNNIASSTIAGAVGGGGIGAIAITYGYQSFNDKVLYTSVIILYLLVQFVQAVGNKVYERKI